MISPERLRLCLYVLLSAALLANVMWHSFIEEDAFITFRVVDNFVHGFGLRWNIDERVQAYTNPLWMLMHIPLYYVLDNMIWTTFLISWACVIGMLAIVYRTFPGMPLSRLLVLFLLPVALSPMHTMFFTSGLENVLLCLLFIALGYYLVRRPQPQWFAVSLMVSLSAVTRLDSLVFYVPLAATALLYYRREIRWKPLLLGASPLVGWLLFSLFYYGFFQPNTSPAKLATGLPLWSYIRFGFVYCWDTMLGSPWDALLMASAALFFPCLLVQKKARSPEAIAAAAIALGIALYIAYVIRIGGYQLSFRMFSLPAIAACWLWLWRAPSLGSRALCFLSICMLLFSFLAKTAEERQIMPPMDGVNIRGLPWATYLFVKQGPHWYDVRLHEKFGPDHTPRDRTLKAGGPLGHPLFRGSPYDSVIDVLGLSDTLIARLPTFQGHFATGHNERYVPKGYMKAFESGDISEMHPALGQYYLKLRLITRGELFDLERIETIIRFNLGEYEPLREQYIREAYYTPQH